MKSLELHFRSRQGDFELELALATDARSLGLFGPSGSGKTTALECLAGWRAARGTIAVGGRTWLDAPRGIALAPRRRRAGYVPQDALLFPHWDVARNLRASHASREQPGAALLERAIEVLRLGPLLGRTPASLSGGERQRVALARALASAPEILLLDEPFAALEQGLRRELLAYLIRVRERFDLPLVLVSHEALEIQALCEEAVVLQRGRALAAGPAASVLRRHAQLGRGLENVLRGRVRSVRGASAALELESGVELAVPAEGLAPGDTAVVAIGAEELLLAVAPPGPISARNVLCGSVCSLERTAGAVLVDLELEPPPGPLPEEGPRSFPRPRTALVASLTEGAVAELALAPGRAVFALFKATACRVLSSLGDRPSGAQA